LSTGVLPGGASAEVALSTACEKKTRAFQNVRTHSLEEVLTTQEAALLLHPLYREVTLQNRLFSERWRSFHFDTETRKKGSPSTPREPEFRGVVGGKKH